MPKARPNKEIDDVYSHIIIHKAKRYGILVLVTIMFFILSSFIFANMIYGVHWIIFGVPACLMCSVLLLAPISEEWNYKPWQRYPRQVERHYLD